MSVQSIGRVGASAIQRAGLENEMRMRLPEAGPSFADTLKGALQEVGSLQQTSQDAIGAFVRGEPVELHQVMAAAEEAGIALDMLVEVRNKLVDAYRSVISMQS
jgi:flagellar hook-basal body complex protein FliE